MADNIKAIFTTVALTDLLQQITPQEKASLELDQCEFTFSSEHNLVVVDGPINIVDGLKRKIPFFVDALKKLRAHQKEKELEELRKEVREFEAAHAVASK